MVLSLDTLHPTRLPMPKILSNAQRPEDLIYDDPYLGLAVNTNIFVGGDDPKMDRYFGSDRRSALEEATKVFKRLESERRARNRSI